MKHYGDITKLSGYELPIVDVITGGSPCQDLSVAGKRAGLAGERSGLFMEQIRIIKEMREHDRASGRPDEFIRPRWMVWENVPGAFSSAGKGMPKGSDFQAVLTEIVKIVKPDTPDVPLPTRGGWSKSGCLMGYGDNGCPFSIAYRVHDAQFWGATQYIDGRVWISGTPQRRKRISLVADFGGLCAPEVLFERKGLHWHSTESGKAREGTAGDAEESTDVTSWGFEPGAARRLDPENRFNEELSPTLRSEMGDNQVAVVYGMSSFDSNAMKSSNPHSGIYEAETSRTLDLNGGNPACNQGGMMVVQSAGFDGNMGAKAENIGYEEEKAPTLNAGKPMHCVCLNDQGGSSMSASDDVAGTLRAQEHGHQPIVFDASRRHNYESFGDICETVQAAYGTGGGNVPIVLEGNGSRPSHRGDGYAESETMYTLNSTEHHAVCYRGDAITSPVNASNPQPGDPCHTLCGDSRNYVLTEEPTMIEMTSTKNTIVEDGISPTLTARMGTGGNQVNAVCYTDTYQKTTGLLMASGYDKLGTQEAMNDMYVVQNMQINATCTDIGFFQSYDEKSGTLLARQYKDPPVVSYGVQRPIVRRLTPLEVERLQGFPDGWTDIGDWVDSKGKKHKGDADSPRYKALGNSIALPFWQYLARRICAQYERDITIGSLFDGIGGFPYVFERCGAKAVWASEIEEFPIAVTKRHFPE